MKTLRRLTSVSVLVIASMTSSLCLAQFPFGAPVCPYLGADVEGRYLNFGNSGQNVFKKNYLQGNIYGGISFWEFLGIEAGYESTAPKTTYNNVSTGTVFLGLPLNGLVAPISTQGRFQLSAWHASIVGFFPICIPETNFYLSLGAAYLRANIWATLLGDAVGTLTPAANLYRANPRKTVIRAAGGFEYFFNPCAGLRVSLKWENTARFKNIRNENQLPFNYVASLKNSWIYGIGLFTKF